MNENFYIHLIQFMSDWVKDYSEFLIDVCTVFVIFVLFGIELQFPNTYKTGRGLSESDHQTSKR